jgi:hypothetical protein
VQILKNIDACVPFGMEVLPEKCDKKIDKQKCKALARCLLKLAGYLLKL